MGHAAHRLAARFRLWRRWWWRGVDANAHAEPDAYSDSNTHADSNTHSDTNSNSNSNSNSDANSDANSDSDADSDADADPHPTTGDRRQCRPNGTIGQRVVRQ